MISDKLMNFLESYDSISGKNTSKGKCIDLLKSIRDNENLQISELNPNGYRHISDCISIKEKNDFSLAQDVSMTIEWLINFQDSRDFYSAIPKSVYELSPGVSQRFTEIREIVSSIVLKKPESRF